MLVSNVLAGTTYKPPISDTPPQNLKSKLIHEKIIDEFFKTLGFGSFPPIREKEKSRLLIWLKKPVELSFGELSFEAPIHDVLFTLINAASKEAFSDKMRIKFVGSFVLSILGRSYLEHLFEAHGIKLNEFYSEEEWKEIEKDFNKTHRDIDLRIYLPNADKKFREQLRKTIAQTLIPLAAKYGKKMEKDVEPHIHGYLVDETICPNIMDGSTSYLRTPIGSKKLMLDIQWVQSLGREKLFEEDDISLEVKHALFANPDKMHEIVPETSSKTLQPFIDVLFKLISIFDASTVNKRGWAKIVLKEIKGKKVLVEKDMITLFNTAFSLFVKGTKKKSDLFADNFAKLIAFCHQEHTFLDFTSHFLLYLQGLFNLIYFQNRPSLICQYNQEDIEAIKNELIKIYPPTNEEGVLSLLFSYLDDKEMTIDILLDLVTLYGNTYGLNFAGLNAAYRLDLKGRIPKNVNAAAQFLIRKLNKASLTETEVRLAIAVNKLVPKNELKELVAFNVAPHLKTNDHPIVDIPISVFTNMREMLDRYMPSEAVARALFSHPSSFDLALKWAMKNQELTYLRASFAVSAVSIDPVQGLKVAKPFFFSFKPKEKKIVLKHILNQLLKENRERFGTTLNGLSELIKYSPEPDLSFEQYNSLCSQYPEFKSALTPFMTVERFHKEAGFLSLISGTSEELDDFFKSFSIDSIKWLVESCNASSPQFLALVRTLDRKGSIDSRFAFKIIFGLNVNAKDLPSPLYNRLLSSSIDLISGGHYPAHIPVTSERICEVALACNSRIFMLASLEAGFVTENPYLFNIIERLLSHTLDEQSLRRMWPYALETSLKFSFLFIAARTSNLEKEAIAQLNSLNIESRAVSDEVYRQIDANNWTLVCSLIRQFNSKLPLDEIIPILMNRINNAIFLSQQAMALFELFQQPALLRHKQKHAGVLYRKIAEACSDILDMQVYGDIKDNFTLDEIVLKNLTGYLLSSIKTRNRDEIRAQIPYLVSLFKKVTNYVPLEKHLSLLVRPELFSSEQDMELLACLSPHSKEARKVETALFIESENDDKFLAGMERRDYKRFPLEHAARLYKLKPQACLEAAKIIQDPTTSELEALFDIFNICPLHPLFISMIHDGFFNALRRTNGRKTRVEQLSARLDAEKGILLSSTPLLKGYLEDSGYSQLLRWRNELIKSHSSNLSLFNLGMFSDEDKIPILQAQFFLRPDLRPSVYQEVNRMAPASRLKFFKRAIKEIRGNQAHHCLPFFTSFIKSNGFIKLNEVLDVLVQIAILYPDHFEEALNSFMTEWIKTAVPNFKGFRLHCDKVEVCALEWYQESENPVSLIPYVGHPQEKKPPANIENAFFQVLGLILSKFCSTAISLHKSPRQAAYLLDFVANNLYLRSQDIKFHEGFKEVLNQFFRPIICNVKKHPDHIRNLDLIHNSMYQETVVSFDSEEKINHHIFLGASLFRESLPFIIPNLVSLFHNLTLEYPKEPYFAPVSLLQAINLIKKYDIELFKATPKIRVDICKSIFDAIMNYPFVLKHEEVCFSKVLEAILPENKGLSEQEYVLYNELIHHIRTNCSLLFKRAEIEFLPDAMNFYCHLFENGFVRNDASFLNNITAIINSCEESLKDTTSDKAFEAYAVKLKKFLCLNLSNKKILLDLFAPFHKGLVDKCLEKLKESPHPRAKKLHDELAAAL